MTTHEAWRRSVPDVIFAAGPAGISSGQLAEQLGRRRTAISNALCTTRQKREKAGLPVNVWTLLDIGFEARYFGRKEWRDEAEDKRGPMQSHRPKTQQPKPVIGLSGPIVGPIPAAQVLPSQPVYARHHLAALPPGFVSSLNPAECRPWAAMVGQA